MPPVTQADSVPADPAPADPVPGDAVPADAVPADPVPGDSLPVDRPWTAECEVDATLARALIAEQFPDLGQAAITPLGAGWDNTAYLLDQQWVFRFPRRQIAVALIDTECRLLPAIADALPLPIPMPSRVGRPSARFAWPFAGYRLLPGRSACSAALTADERAAAAEPLAHFLAALHAVPTQHAAAHGARPDDIRRLDLDYRVPRVRERLRTAASSGLIDDSGRWEPILDAAPREHTAPPPTLVHGDLYARHLLVDDRARPCGVIDWGDVHLGDPAVDISIAAGFLPPAAVERFRITYGPIDDATWRLARFRALLSAVTILAYGADVGDAALVSEGRVALGHLAPTGAAR